MLNRAAVLAIAIALNNMSLSAAETQPTQPPGAHSAPQARKTDCDANGCRVLHRNATAPTIAFKIELERAQATWRFEGYGIVAIWGIPED